MDWVIVRFHTCEVCAVEMKKTTTTNWYTIICPSDKSLSFTALFRGSVNYLSVRLMRHRSCCSNFNVSLGCCWFCVRTSLRLFPELVEIHRPLLMLWFARIICLARHGRADVTLLSFEYILAMGIVLRSASAHNSRGRFQSNQTIIQCLSQCRESRKFVCVICCCYSTVVFVPGRKMTHFFCCVQANKLYDWKFVEKETAHTVFGEWFEENKKYRTERKSHRPSKFAWKIN